MGKYHITHDYDSVLHELFHIGVREDDPLKTFVRDHDLTDFRCIVDEYGRDWSKTRTE
ncbi:MAG: hypothetical protein JNG50_04040 [Mogibacterium sp.]|uniref:putative metallopeptidase n=1 Tax=Mogibacterium sp. TaxID=2049035 RepID=UPI001A3A0E09|nr:putative metallopeptidase [Mogibacterium sp.]MBL6468651.1 hypothetical protein [Mogibacterium sp.]